MPSSTDPFGEESVYSDAGAESCSRILAFFLMKPGYGDGRVFMAALYSCWKRGGGMVGNGVISSQLLERVSRASILGVLSNVAQSTKKVPTCLVAMKAMARTSTRYG